MKLLLYILICILPLTVSAQFTQGIVRDEAGKALQGVIVVNKRTVDGAVTDNNGCYKLKAIYGDTIIHMMAYYATKKTLASPGVAPAVITLATLSYTLDGVEILPELESTEGT
ncbi:MAG: hypothetical protein H6550_16500 [Chitinophagales bacterium]|nr:hypothetical protein [Chitinophagales bacterium]